MLQVCPKCSTQNAAGATRCSACGERLRRAAGLGPLGLLLTALLVAGGVWLAYFQVWPMLAGRSEVAALPTDVAEGGASASVESDIAAMSTAFRLPADMVRSVSAAWTTSIRRRHPDHEAAEIIGAVAHSVRTLGTRGSIRSYFEEYWALADGGREPEQIKAILRAQMFRGR